MLVIGRFAESEDPVLYADHGEVDKCEFIKVNAPKEAWEAWSSTDDDGAGLLVKAGALREQAREALVRASMSMCGPLCLLLPSAPRSPFSGARGAPHCGDEGACGKEGACGDEGVRSDEGACGGGQERDVAVELLPGPAPPPSNILLTYVRYLLTTHLLYNSLDCERSITLTYVR